MDIPAEPELSVYQNPSSGYFNFDIELKEDARMALEIFNCSGKKVATLVKGQQKTGYYKLQWEYRGNAGGIYYYRFSNGQYIKNGKLVIIK
jgi:Secretion system C-terminal sorting domain